MKKTLEGMFSEYGVSILWASVECCSWVLNKLSREDARKAVAIINQVKKKYGAPLYYPAYGTNGF